MRYSRKERKLNTELTVYSCKWGSSSILVKDYFSFKIADTYIIVFSIYFLMSRFVGNLFSKTALSITFHQNWRRTKLHFSGGLNYIIRYLKAWYLGHDWDCRHFLKFFIFKLPERKVKGYLLNNPSQIHKIQDSADSRFWFSRFKNCITL